MITLDQQGMTVVLTAIAVCAIIFIAEFLRVIHRLQIVIHFLEMRVRHLERQQGYVAECDEHEPGLVTFVSRDDPGEPNYHVRIEE